MLAPEMFNDAAKAGACGAALMTRTWQTVSSAAWATPHSASASASQYGACMTWATNSRPAVMIRLNRMVAPSGLRSTRRPPSQLPNMPAPPKAIMVQPTTLPSKPARCSSMSAR
ncbi:Uncharacterised protein [Bordetella pertussis]|nr:Uncharacterised protein [Bordetella pertussis]CFM44615.1 Uncharacterised protein [Bordetella pertussis]CFM89144.1 Uncharacterised protein [Bordetella pertussis]CFN36307.1 Uncharacterised protein [Bordetella pertussis]CFN45580.1 Uncharacterised protein [Bordetella pertussis]